MKRRELLKVGLSSLAYFSLEATAPSWIVKSAQALEDTGCFPEDRILLILQQAGGNDGLNTIIPRTDPVYYDNAIRPTLRIPTGLEINLDGLNGLHPEMGPLDSWYQDGHMAIIQNVGYENPNLSHFTSTDFWEFGTIPGDPIGTQGWVAQFFDNTCGGAPNIDPLRLLRTGSSSLPDAFQGTTGYLAPAVNQASSYAFTTNTDAQLRLDAIHALNSMTTVDPTIDFLQRSENTAEASAADMAVAAAEPILVNQYTDDAFGRGMLMASQVIRAGFNTRIFYVSQGGYDTHANQVFTAGNSATGRHADLLRDYALNVDAFLSEMQLTGNLDRVMIMTFSEFGRRVSENGSKGSDHGAANNMMIFGGQLFGGVYGGQPNLTDLIKGNLKYLIDFRAVYSMIMERWMKQDPALVFGQNTYNNLVQNDYLQIPFLANGPTSAKSWSQYR